MVAGGATHSLLIVIELFCFQFLSTSHIQTISYGRLTSSVARLKRLQHESESFRSASQKFLGSVMVDRQNDNKKAVKNFHVVGDSSSQLIIMTTFTKNVAIFKLVTFDFSSLAFMDWIRLLLWLTKRLTASFVFIAFCIAKKIFISAFLAAVFLLSFESVKLGCCSSI